MEHFVIDCILDVKAERFVEILDFVKEIIGFVEFLTFADEMEVKILVSNIWQGCLFDKSLEVGSERVLT